MSEVRKKRKKDKARRVIPFGEIKRGFFRAIGTGLALLLILLALIAFALYTGQDFDFGTIVINGSQLKNL